MNSIASTSANLLLPPPSTARRRRRQQQQQQQHNQLYLLIFFICLWCQSYVQVCALYLTNQQSSQQQHSQVMSSSVDPNNGAIIQALSQFAAQQAAGLQQVGTTNQQQQLTVAQPTNGNNSNSTSPTSIGQQQQQQQQTTGGINSNQFVIKWIHNDPKNQMAYVSITPVNYTNLHEPRIELRYQSKYPYVSLDEKTSNNSVVAAVVVNDEDSGPSGETSLSIEHGNELGHFKLVSTTYTNTIQVSGAPLSRTRVPEYNLTIVARDHGSPPKSSTSNLVIKLKESSVASPITHPPSEFPSGLKPPVTDLMYVGAVLVVMFSAIIFTIIIVCALVQRPKNKTHKNPPPPRATSATNPRPPYQTDQRPYCLGLTNL